MMCTRESRLLRTLTAVVLIVAMLAALAPASISHADADYGFQPEGADDSSNSMKMIDVCGIEDFTKLEETEDAYINQINGEIDGTKAHTVDGAEGKSGIYFTFTMSAGMNNFNRDHFLANNMNLIQIYKADEDGSETGDPVAEYSNGNGALQFWGSHLTEEINNHGSQKTDELYIGVEQGVLGTGDYVIVFGRNICGNNVDKQLGKDIKFLFTVAGTPELSEMIDIAQNFVQEVEDQNRIDEEEPETYSPAEVEKIKAAIEAAKEVQSNAEATEAQREEAADALYQALEAFQDSIHFSIDEIAISGIPDQIHVGDTGTASAKVTARPDRSEYKRVSWSVLQYEQGDPESGPAEESAADSLIISETSGSWVAAYSGTVWVKATSLKDPQKFVYKKVEIQAEEGILAVNLADETQTLQGQVEKVLENSGQQAADVTSLKVFTTGTGALTENDVKYMNSLPNLSVLNMKNAQLTQLPGGAFKENKTLTEVVLPDTLTNIEEDAFYNCSSLETIEIPAAVTAIGNCAFAGCTSLNSTLVIHAVCPPSYVTASRFGDAFKGKDGDEPASVTTIKVPYSCGADYRSANGWKNFEIEEGERQVLEVEFTESGTLAEKAQEALDAQGITDDEVTDLKISSPEGVQLSRSTDVNGWLQTHCLYATTIDLSDTEFEDNKCNANTFKERISLKWIELPESTTTIGGTCFYGCKNLRQIKLPEALENMGSGAFGECENVGTSIVSGAVTPPTITGSVFPDCVTTIYVPPQSVEAYSSTDEPVWRTYTIKSQVELSLSARSISLEAGRTGSLAATVTVYNNNVDTVTWESSNSRVASVSPERGKTTTITAEKAGTATITAKAANGYVTAACTVTVRDLAAPTSAKASSAAYNKAKISWSGVSGAQGYIVYRSTNRSSGYSQRIALASSARSYTDTGLKTGTTYYYRVRAYKTVNGTRHLGAYSSIVSAKPALAKAKKVKAKRAGKRKIRVSWKRVTGANGYKVYRSTKKNKGFKAVKTVKSGKTVKYTTGKLKKGKRYYFKVRAYRKVSGKKVYSAWSSRVSCKAR